MTPTELRQLSANFQIVETNYSLTTTSQQVAKANPSRYSIMFCSPQSSGSNFVTTVSTKATVSTAAGFVVLNNNLILDFYQHGALVGQPWYAVSASSVPLQVIEVLFVPLY